jgi:hypothetical protein
LLSTEQLDVLERHWQRQRMPIARNLRSGLSDGEMDALVADLGISLPSEARTWWRWHDGADMPRGYADDRYLRPYFEFLPLEAAIELYLNSRAGWADEREGADYWWPPNQFSIARLSSGDVTFDSAVAEGEPTPIYFSHSHDRRPDIDFAQPGARSWGELVSWWIEAWEQGIYGYDPDTLQWRYEIERIDPARELTGLV